MRNRDEEVYEVRNTRTNKTVMKNVTWNEISAAAAMSYAWPGEPDDPNFWVIIDRSGYSCPYNWSEHTQDDYLAT